VILPNAQCGRATPALRKSRITVGARLLRDGNYLDHTATVVEPFWIDHLFFPLGTTV